MGDFSLFRLKFNKLKYGSENVPLEGQKSTPNEAPNFDDGKRSSFENDNCRFCIQMKIKKIQI
jgi:hypothetical protein